MESKNQKENISFTLTGNGVLILHGLNFTWLLKSKEASLFMEDILKAQDISTTLKNTTLLH